MADTRVRGLRINAQIICDLCKMKFPKGGWMVKGGKAPGVYCSADHAMKAANEKK